MTENTPTPIDPVCATGEDFTDRVTIREIGIAARKLGCNPIIEIESQGPKMWDAMAVLGWLLERRRDPQASFDRWDELTLPALLAAVGIATDEQPADRDARRQLEAEADTENPTDSAHG